MYLLCIFLKFLHYYFYRIGNLLIIIQQDLFTDYLVDKKTSPAYQSIDPYQNKGGNQARGL